MIVGGVKEVKISLLAGNACQEDVCGRGTCVVSNSSNFGFECQCESGWRQARSEDDNELSFLPCVVPNCQFFSYLNSFLSCFCDTLSTRINQNCYVYIACLFVCTCIICVLYYSLVDL